MLAVLQRVARAGVRVGVETIAPIGPRLVILLGVERGDGEEQAMRLARRVAELRLFKEGERHFHHSLLRNSLRGAGRQSVSLLADLSHGRRPDFTRAERGELAEPLVARFCTELRSLAVPIAG